VAHHANQVSGGSVDAKRNLLVLEVVDGVEVPQEQLAEDEVLIVELVEAVLSDGELALAFGLVQVLPGTDLKDCIASFLGARDEEADGPEIALDVIATLVALAEVCV
jgi:hypothetical protein